MATYTFSNIPSIILIAASILLHLTFQNIKPQTHVVSSSEHIILPLDVVTSLHADRGSLASASSDYGKLIQRTPDAVLHASSIKDIISLIKFSYNSASPFKVAARGHGHSIHGQAMTQNGVVINMRSLSHKNNNNNNDGVGIRVSWSSSLGYYVDVGGEQLWIDVLKSTLEHGLAPVSWTDYLYLTVGGTLSNAGISGQTFLHGPQISNVFEMDIITGKGEFMTCTEKQNSELFYAVLGGLGQFGVITRARIHLEPAPKRVKWVRMLYDDFTRLTGDQEHLISIKGLDYVEGSVILDQSPLNNWRSSFFSSSNHSKITSLANKNGIIYSLDVAKYYDDQTAQTIDKDLQILFRDLSYLPDMMYTKDFSYLDFLNRVRSEELKLESKGLWNVPHPWLNIFIPKSSISDFNSGVFMGILLRQQQKKIITGPILVYPMIRNKWDGRMSAVIPDEETFYTVGFLHSSGSSDWQDLEDRNLEILEFCRKSGIKAKQYLPHFETKEDWMDHFGSKWKTFQKRKDQFDPKAILSPGQRIFNSFDGNTNTSTTRNFIRLKTVFENIYCMN